MKTIRVDLGDRGYDVLVGTGALDKISSVLPARSTRAAIVTQANIPIDIDLGVEHRVFTVPEGERGKTMATVEALCSGFAQWGMTRSDVVVAVGGGMVTDVGGFAAALYHRGIAVVHVATTLLAQVDAAIGGKTGVNLPEGKNLVGAFWQPFAVICDTDTLKTLPERELRSGTGEIAKYHFLGEPGLDTLPLEERVARCVAVKARVVAADERESDLRATLNYGHTLGHALEIATDFSLSHGEAVSIGIAFAARLARTLGRIDDARVAEHDRVLAFYDLPSAVPAGIDPTMLIEVMTRDKKRATAGLTFVLDGPAGLELVDGVDPGVVAGVIEEVTAG